MRRSSLGTLGLLLALSSPLFSDQLPSSKQGKETSGMVNPSSRFQVEGGWNLFLNTEFLWWIPKEDGLYYAQDNYSGVSTSALPPNGSQNFSGSLKKVHPHFRPGFRVALGGNMGYDEWDILTSWTWLDSTASSGKKGLLLTLWGRPAVTGNPTSTCGASEAFAKWKLGVNIFDVEMGRSFWAGSHFSLRPFIGIRGAWIDQLFHIHYKYTTTPATHSQIRALSDFSGGGARLGLDMRFSLLSSWSLYGLGSASMLYGYYDANYSQKWGEKRIAHSRDGFHQAGANAQLAMGVRWDTYLHRDRYHFGLYAGWEQNIWFGLNKMNHFFGSLSEGNLEKMDGELTLSGGTAGVRFDF